MPEVNAKAIGDQLAALAAAQRKVDEDAAAAGTQVPALPTLPEPAPVPPASDGGSSHGQP